MTIINELSELINTKKLFKNKNELIDSMENYIKLKKERIINNTSSNLNKIENEKIKVSEIDYFYSNVIARASKTMSECRSNLIKTKKTGTDG